MVIKKILLVLLVLLVLSAGAGVWFWQNSKSSFTNLPSLNFGELFATQNSESSKTPKLLTTYTNPDYGFSFHYPDGMKLDEFEEEKGRVILAENFQIFITPFDEEGPLTPERVKKDLPNLAIKNLQTATLDGVPALAFESAEENFGETFEVWFVYPPEPYPHGNYLYQITAPITFKEKVVEILSSWKFINR